METQRAKIFRKEAFSMQETEIKPYLTEICFQEDAMRACPQR